MNISKFLSITLLMGGTLISSLAVGMKETPPRIKWTSADVPSNRHETADRFNRYEKQIKRAQDNNDDLRSKNKALLNALTTAETKVTEVERTHYATESKLIEANTTLTNTTNHVEELKEQVITLTKQLNDARKPFSQKAAEQVAKAKAAFVTNFSQGPNRGWTAAAALAGTTYIGSKRAKVLAHHLCSKGHISNHTVEKVEKAAEIVEEGTFANFLTVLALNAMNSKKHGNVIINTGALVAADYTVEKLCAYLGIDTKQGWNKILAKGGKYGVAGIITVGAANALPQHKFFN